MIKPISQITHDFSFLDNPASHEKRIEVLIILNQPVVPQQFLSLRKHSRFLIFADGGSNRVYDTILRTNPSAIPDAIVGDLDSVHSQVLDFYVSKGTLQCKIKNQDYTDFEKAFHYGIKMIQEKEAETSSYRPIVCFLGAFGGRIDQTLSSIHNAVKFANSYPHFDIMLCDPNSMMIPLNPTLPDPTGIDTKEAKSNYSFHRIISSKYELEDGCGLIPIHTAQRFIISEGLKWELGDEVSSLKFGVFISSSNMRVASQVKIWNSDLIFWSSSLTFKKSENFTDQRTTQ